MAAASGAAVVGDADQIEGSLGALLSRGPICELIADLLSAVSADAATSSELLATTFERVSAVADPLADDDLQLALYVCFELHYRSFPDLDPAWEWNPVLLAVRGLLEKAFLQRLESEINSRMDPVDPETVGDLLFELEAGDSGVSLSRHLEIEAGIEEFREFVIHRSLYQLKEADPHSWAIPRLSGAAKTALLEIQGDEYGGGRPERMHSVLFAKTMRALDLKSQENAYLALVPGSAIATVNLMSALGLRRSRRGAIVGHLAMFEMTSALPNRRYANALRRLGFDDVATDFYDEHVEADAVHENIAAYDLAGGLARAEPELADDIIFGARALLYLEDRFARELLDSWQRGESSLRPAT
jgi:hypothetical protein